MLWTFRVDDEVAKPLRCFSLLSRPFTAFNCLIILCHSQETIEVHTSRSFDDGATIAACRHCRCYIGSSFCDADLERVSAE